MPTIQESIIFASKRIDRFEAKLLLAHCLGVGRTYLITHDRDELPPSVWEKYKNGVQQRSEGMPIPYICGSQEFFGRPFKVTPDVLIPRPDTETLVEFILNSCAPEHSASLLDLGTGSGCIAVTLALEKTNFKVSATDVCERALNVARQNAHQLKASVNFYLGSWFDAIPTGKMFDIIVSNPPYIHQDDEHLKNLTYEPIGALTDGFNGLTHIEHIISQAPYFLTSNGLLAFEHGWDQGEAVRAIFEKNGCWEKIQTIKDLGNNDRVTAAYLSPTYSNCH